MSDNELQETDGDESDTAPQAATDPTSTAAADDKLPIAYHELPASVPNDLAWSMDVKHVIDLTPCPNLFAADILESGGSYFGLCSTEYMKKWMQENLKKELIKRASNPQSAMAKILGRVLRDTTEPKADEPMPTEPPKKKPKNNKQNAAAATGSGEGGKTEGGKTEGGNSGGLDLGKLLEEARKKAAGGSTAAGESEDTVPE